MHQPLQPQGVEVDVTATVYRVIDGDTLDAFPIGRVRLADVDAPELGEPKGPEAKAALAKLILKAKVYLDVDDLYVMDKYNRLVCVVYVRYNATHLLNVNKWLVDEGHADPVNYPNEFDPDAWAPYVHYPIEFEEVSRAEYDRLKAEYDRLKAEYDKLKLGYLDLEVRHKELAIEHESLRAKYDGLKADYDESELDRKRLTYAYEELSEAFGILNSEYERVVSSFIMTQAYGALTTAALLAVGVEIVRRKLAMRRRLKGP